MTSEEEHVYPFYRSPRDIRNESFTHRRRGLDEKEVREFLDIIADQVEAIEWERTAMVAELEQLKAQHQVTPGSVSESVPEQVQATELLRRAQEVADQLLDAARHEAEEIVAGAQRQGHEVVRQARVKTHERMQSLYEELDRDFRRIGEAVPRSAPDRLPPAPPRNDG